MDKNKIEILRNKTKQLIEYYDQIDIINNQLNSIKNNKNELSNDIMSIMMDNNIENKPLKINNNIFKIKETEINSNLSNKHLKTIIYNYCLDKPNINNEELYQFIIKNKQIKYKKFLDRSKLN